MIRTNRAHLNVAALSHPGKAGKINEDRFAATAYRIDAFDTTPSVFAIVSDGIGGHRAGEVAAELAVNAISHTVAHSNASRPLDTLAEAVSNANQSILEQAGFNPDLHGMGATCACAWVIGNRLYTASLGDSRIYLLRGNHLTRVTTDHTWIQEALDRGMLTPDQVHSHPNAHVIRRYLGSSRPPATDVRLRLKPDESDTQSLANQGLRLISRDVLLLCTDGLTDLVRDGEIRDILATSDPETAAQLLINQANERGGHDNITVIVMAVPSKQDRNKKSRLWLWLAGGIAGLLIPLLAIFAMIGALLRLNRPVVQISSPTPTSTEFAILMPSTTDGTPVLNTGAPLPPAVFSSPATYTPWPTNQP